jgi:hypothetical protein
MGVIMNKIILALIASAFTMGPMAAQTWADSTATEKPPVDTSKVEHKPVTPDMSATTQPEGSKDVTKEEAPTTATGAETGAAKTSAPETHEAGAHADESGCPAAEGK